MKSLLPFVCLLLVFLQATFAQRRSGGRGVRQPSPVQSSTSGALFLSGKVVLSDGSTPTQTVLIQSVCHGQSRTETHTDSHGDFSFQFGDRISSIIESGFDAELPASSRSTSRSPTNDAKDCELIALLAGYSSDKISLDSRINGSQNVDVGRIALHRLANVEGFTISATSAAAPKPAQKAFSKGLEQEKKGQWEEAQKSFEKAVRLYPKFAAAWCELGAVQIQQKDREGARQSFEQSIAADEKYVHPYHALMRLVVDSQNWHRVVEISDKLLALNPIHFPDAWYFNGVGYFYLENFTAAEKSARRGLAVDGSHRVPKLEYLLGVVLAKMSNYGDATRHLQAYLRMVTTPAEVAEAHKQLDQIARLWSAQAQTTSQQ